MQPYFAAYTSSCTSLDTLAPQRAAFSCAKSTCSDMLAH